MDSQQYNNEWYQAKLKDLDDRYARYIDNLLQRYKSKEDPGYVQELNDSKKGYDDQLNEIKEKHSQYLQQQAKNEEETVLLDEDFFKFAEDYEIIKNLKQEAIYNSNNCLNDKIIENISSFDFFNILYEPRAITYSYQTMLACLIFAMEHRGIFDILNDRAEITQDIYETIYTNLMLPMTPISQAFVATVKSGQDAAYYDGQNALLGVNPNNPPIDQAGGNTIAARRHNRAATARAALEGKRTYAANNRKFLTNLFKIRKSVDLRMFNDIKIGYILNELRNLTPAFVYQYSHINCRHDENQAMCQEGEIYSINEYVDNTKTLRSWIASDLLTPKEVDLIIFQVVYAMALTMKYKFVHNNLNFDNIIVQQLPYEVEIPIYRENSLLLWLKTDLVARIINYKDAEVGSDNAFNDIRTLFTDANDLRPNYIYRNIVQFKRNSTYTIILNYIINRMDLDSLINGITEDAGDYNNVFFGHDHNVSKYGNYETFGDVYDLRDAIANNPIETPNRWCSANRENPNANRIKPSDNVIQQARDQINADAALDIQQFRTSKQDNPLPDIPAYLTTCLPILDDGIKTLRGYYRRMHMDCFITNGKDAVARLAGEIETWYVEILDKFYTFLDESMKFKIYKNLRTIRDGLQREYDQTLYTKQGRLTNDIINHLEHDLAGILHSAFLRDKFRNGYYTVEEIRKNQENRRNLMKRQKQAEQYNAGNLDKESQRVDQPGDDEMDL